jgi:hypothetical protein
MVASRQRRDYGSRGIFFDKNRHQAMRGEGVEALMFGVVIVECVDP